MGRLKDAIEEIKSSIDFGDSTYLTEGEVIIFLEELQRLRNLEEQGRLMELPIPLWKPYYEITESFNISMYILKPASAGRIIQNGLFGKYVFATKEEAEAKLKELKEGAE